MILILEVYDILKRIRKNLKVNEKLQTKTGAVYAADESVKEYTVVNHRDQIQTQMVMKVNTELQQR